MKPIKLFKVLAALGALFLVFVGVLLARALQLRTAPEIAPIAARIPIDAKGAVKRLARALTFKTVSLQDASHEDQKPFLDLHRFLDENFPHVRSGLRRELINKYGLLYEWPGSDVSLKPMLFLAHQDVVPVIPDDAHPWKHPPFAGIIDDGFIWGRGAIDDKHNLLALMESAEWLLSHNFRPKRTVLFAFGFDEEIGGFEGAAYIAEVLRERHMELEFIFDEGGYITEGVIPGIKAPVALIGTAEKGYVTLEVVSHATPGHSSMPPDQTAIGILSTVVDRLQENQFPRSIRGAMRDMFMSIGGYLPFSQRLAIANLWLFGPLVIRSLSRGPTGSATLQTTTAPTIFNGGAKENVLPAQAKVTLNFRTLPGDTIADVVSHVKKAADGLPIDIKVLRESREASPVSSIETPIYRHLKNMIPGLYPGTVVAPFLFVGGTDSTNYLELCKNVYRFFPAHFSSDDLHRLHGTDERISIQDYVRSIQYMIELIRTSP